MTPERLSEISEELRGLIDERLGIRARSFPDAVRRAGRLLPGAAREAAEFLVEMDRRLGNPKLAARTDAAPAEAAADKVRRYLTTLTPHQRRQRERSFLFAEIGFRVAVVLALIVGVLVWRGYV